MTTLTELLALCEKSIRCHADEAVSSKEWSRARATFRQASSEEVVAALVRVAMAADYVRRDYPSERDGDLLRPALWADQFDKERAKLDAALAREGKT